MKAKTYSASAKIINNNVSEGVSAQLIVAVYDGEKLESVYSVEGKTANMSEQKEFNINNSVIFDSS